MVPSREKSEEHCDDFRQHLDVSLYFLSIGGTRVKADLHRARVSHAGLRASETLDPTRSRRMVIVASAGR